MQTQMHVNKNRLMNQVMKSVAFLYISQQKKNDKAKTEIEEI